MSVEMSVEMSVGIGAGSGEGAPGALSSVAASAERRDERGFVRRGSVVTVLDILGVVRRLYPPAPLSATMRQVKRLLLDEAREQVAAYPQYHSVFCDGNWRLARARRSVETKGGLVMVEGDVLLALRESPFSFGLWKDFRTVWSFPRAGRVSVPVGDIEYLEP